MNGSIEDATAFTEFLSNKGRINFWEKPFIKVGDDYLFLLLPLTQPNILYLIDRWLEEGGVSLNSRGPQFELHMKRVIKSSLDKKKYKYCIPPRSKFECKNGKEEIDLVVILKHIVIVAELKCIRYPLEARDIANSFLRIENGAKQLKRKVQFLTANWVHFKSELGELENKKVVSLVICNYPLFSGQAIDNISVVDAVLIDSYFDEGALSKAKITNENGKETREIIEKTQFYVNEDEFSYNFERLMKNPPAIEQKIDLMEVKFNRLNLDFFKYNILVEVADFKE